MISYHENLNYYFKHISAYLAARGIRYHYSEEDDCIFYVDYANEYPSVGRILYRFDLFDDGGIKITSSSVLLDMYDEEMSDSSLVSSICEYINFVNVCMDTAGGYTIWGGKLQCRIIIGETQTLDADQIDAAVFQAECGWRYFGKGFIDIVQNHVNVDAVIKERIEYIDELWGLTEVFK